MLALWWPAKNKKRLPGSSIQKDHLASAGLSIPFANRESHRILALHDPDKAKSEIPVSQRHPTKRRRNARRAEIKLQWLELKP